MQIIRSYNLRSVYIRLTNSIFLIALTSFVCYSNTMSLDDTSRVKVFILAGQSNAVGYNHFKEYNHGSDELLHKIAKLDHVMFWPGSNSRLDLQGLWTKLQLGASAISTDETFKQSYGPEIGIGLTLSKALPGDEIAIIKFADGGTGIARSEDYNDYIPALVGFDDKGVNWHPPTDGKPAGLLYKGLLDNINNALLALKKMNKQYEICGFFWMQGEHEAGISKKMASDYGSLLNNLRGAVRSDLNIKNLPFIVGEINTHTWIYGDIARSKQRRACARDSYSILIKTTDLPRGGKGGEAHFTSEGMIILGERFANGIIKFISRY